MESSTNVKTIKRILSTMSFSEIMEIQNTCSSLITKRHLKILENNTGVTISSETSFKINKSATITPERKITSRKQRFNTRPLIDYTLDEYCIIFGISNILLTKVEKSRKQRKLTREQKELLDLELFQYMRKDRKWVKDCGDYHSFCEDSSYYSSSEEDY